MQKQDTSKALAPHLEEIARVIHRKIGGKREGWGTTNFVVRREVTRLTNLAGTRRLVSHSATFRRALNELHGRELAYLSQRRAVANTINTIARWLDLAHILPRPSTQSTTKEIQANDHAERYKGNCP
jgi:hypothetical protein